MNAYGRRGYSLVELLVVLVIGLILVLASYQVLATNTRIHAVVSAGVQGQQTLGGAVDILSGELREISPRGGDLVQMAANSLTIRAQRTLGLVCAVNYGLGNPEITTFRVGPGFEAGDSVFVFHDNDPDLASDDEWFGGEIRSVDDNATCSGSPAQELGVPFVGSTANAFPPDSVRVGAPVRGFDVFTYAQYVIDGEPYLGRQARGASDPDALVGPVLPAGGIAFRYLDSIGQATTVDTLVAQIELTVRFQSAARTVQNEPVGDSIVVRIYPRN